MKQVEFVPFRLTETADIYSIRINGKEKTEFQEFLINFKDVDDEYLKSDFNRILASLNTMINNGIKERYFRTEGKIHDRTNALPLYITPRPKQCNGTLRLYCIRISDQLLILGGGGEKITQTYDEDAALSDKVHTLQSIDSALRELEEDGIDIHLSIDNLIINIP
jgi:hypothetical protein